MKGSKQPKVTLLKGTKEAQPIQWGHFTAGDGYIEIVVPGRKAIGRMNALFCAWLGSGYLGVAHSLN